MKTSEMASSSTEMGSLGVMHLKRLWGKAMLARAGRSQPHWANEFRQDNIVLHGLGLALEETLGYLYQQGPSFAAFEQWIREANGGAPDPLQIERINATITGDPGGAWWQQQLLEIEADPPVLSNEDLAFWEEHGYVLVPDAVPSANCEAALAAIYDHLNIDPGRVGTWYEWPQDHGIMVQFFRHAALEANRRSRRIHKAFAQIWNETNLWVTIDRVSFNPPERGDWFFPGPRLHWDTSLELPIRFDVGGLLYLTDTLAEQGAFTCVPGFHKRIGGWLESLPSGADPRREDLEALGARAIPGRAGDLVIWHQALPHGSCPNRAQLPRIVQYVSMYPARIGHNPEWR
jgi:Phytanoyl-CoA dioxygenase (PhyH)